MLATRKRLMICFAVLTAAALAVLVSFGLLNKKRIVTTDASHHWDYKSIPKIIHQTFKSEMVYENYRPLIQSCLALNPDWKYYLWRDADAVAFIKDKYPQFLSRYNGYPDNLERSDSIRYMVLHHFGGIYLDMDVECVRPFYPALSQLPAFLDQERTEQTNILWSQPYCAMNSVMGSVAGHQFFGHMVDAMLSAGRGGDSVHSFGPMLLTRHQAMYMAAAASAAANSVGAGARARQPPPPPPPPPVFLVPPSTFSPMMDPKKNWRTLCKDHLSPGRGPNSWKTSGCRALAAKDWQLGEQDSSTIAIHRFLHLDYSSNTARRRPHFNISRAFPERVSFYS